MDQVIEQAQKMAEFYESAANSLHTKYPGVRPGWVSTEISMALESAKRYRDMVAELQQEGE